jgi:nitrogen fixation protein NifB
MNKKADTTISPFANHPCFSDSARHAFGRIHLPVAPKCNIQCNFCDRRFDCLNESRPGVSSVILSPHQALVYLEKTMSVRKDISVAGIAGPGDPFANPEETMETLRLVRKKFPKLILCVATNGLNVFPYLKEMAKLSISHISITINAVDPAIGEKIYAWVRDGITIYRGREAAEVLICRQLEALVGIKENHIAVKINTIIIPGINDGHIAEIAQKTRSAGADIMNPIPLLPVAGTAFENIPSPSPEIVGTCRAQAAEYLSIMSHCTRCRSDAVGLLGEKVGNSTISLLQSCAALPLMPLESRPYIACATREGALVNLHLGHAEKFHIYAYDGGSCKLVAVRSAPAPGGGDRRWVRLAEILADCRAVLAESAGAVPREALRKLGIKVIVTSGLIEENLAALFTGKAVRESSGQAGCAGDCSEQEIKPSPGKGCGGCAGQGCG